MFLILFHIKFALFSKREYSAAAVIPLFNSGFISIKNAKALALGPLIAEYCNCPSSSSSRTPLSIEPKIIFPLAFGPVELERKPKSDIRVSVREDKL